MDWRDHISVDPGVCHGAPCIKGTRVTVAAIVDSVVGGDSRGDVAVAFKVTPEDVQAALLYAAEINQCPAV